jgi:hypothetical protein
VTVTVTDTESDTDSWLYVATTVVVPTANAATLPALSTVAVAGLRDTQTAVAPGTTAPAEFLTVVVSDALPPTVRDNDLGEMAMLPDCLGVVGASSSPLHPTINASPVMAAAKAAEARCALAIFDLLKSPPIPLRVRVWIVD